MHWRAATLMSVWRGKNYGCLIARIQIEMHSRIVARSARALVCWPYMLRGWAVARAHDYLVRERLG